MLDLQSSDFLSLEEIKEMAPSVFTTNGSKSASDKYTHIPTDRVIRDLEVLGWKVVDVKEVAARKEDNKGFQKHLVVFRNEDVVITGNDGDTVYPQILLTNSHDGKFYDVYTEPKDIILYESTACLHGRPKEFQGKYFRNFYMHYGVRDLEYVGMRNRK